MAVAEADPVVALRVTKDARAGRERGCPDAARAPARTVTVLNVPTAQWSFGEIDSTVPVASHARFTSVVGSTVIDAATDAGSIGALNRIETGSVRPRLVEKVVVKAAWVSGRIGVGGRATVGVG
jgi:hypothetical protein